MPKRKLLYLPVERYKERWTEYVSGPTGMFMSCAKEFANVLDVEVIASNDHLHGIGDGSPVLDTRVRTAFAFWQVQEILRRIYSGEINDDTLIYIEDMWLPGIEMIPYACHLVGVHPKAYAFCHAQSVDPNDFTAGMKDWIRPIEQGIANWLTGIFVAADAMKDMLIVGGVRGYSGGYKSSEKDKIHVTGTVYRRATLYDRDWLGTPVTKDRQVVFASRMNKEKQPEFFVDVAKAYNEQWDDTRFKVVSGRSINNHLAGQFINNGISLAEGVNKEQYFHILSESQVLFNCSLQDFVGYVQLDALAAGCAVLCPDTLAFPDFLQYDDRFLYFQGSVEDAVRKLRNLITGPRFGLYDLYNQFGARYERSVARMIGVMLK